MFIKRCSVNGIMNEFIVVDDDEVIIFDFFELFKKGKVLEILRVVRGELVLQRVISIDDDDDDDIENVYKDGSSLSCMYIFVEVDGDDDDCQFV